MSTKQPTIVFKHGSMMAMVYARHTDAVLEGKPQQLPYVVLKKRERDHNGKWLDVKELYESDIPKAVLVLQKCFDFMTSTGFHSEER